jgi:hypothetical protein
MSGRRLGCVWAFLGSLMPAGLTGAFVALCFRLGEPGEPNRMALLLLGWLYGVAVLGLIRLFRVRTGLYPVIGLICGPVPLALIANGGMDPSGLGGGAAVAALGGVLVGAVEWGRLRRRDAEPSD